MNGRYYIKAGSGHQTFRTLDITKAQKYATKAEADKNKCSNEVSVFRTM
jgi:hypothetical protein